VSLTLHRAERSDALVRRLAGVLSAVPADPFTPEVVAVPSKGVERWIAQSLATTLGATPGTTLGTTLGAGGEAGADGVCANVDFPSPGRLVRDALAAAWGVDADEDRWSVRRLPWSVLEVIDSCAHEDWCRTLGRHLGLHEDTVRHGRRMAVAQKLARLYSAYAAERPAMLLDWRAGHDTDGYDGPLSPDLAWQAELWRRVRAHIGTESTAEQLGPGCRTIRDDPGVVDLPERFCVFGPTRLTLQQLTVIEALAAHREVHLWLPHPSDGLWRHMRGDAAVVRRRDDPTAETPRHPLIRSLGRDAREMQLRLAAHTSPTSEEHLATPAVPGTLLGALQRDLHGDRAPTGDHRFRAGDTSVQVHACHGRHRQVEVLREVLLGLLADDPTLESRDIIVMCPDVEAYAPLIAAAFGVEATHEAAGDQLQEHPGHQLTFRLADRALRQTNPVLGVLSRLLDLADSRLTASQVLDLTAMPPVRRRFGFDEDDLERLGDWVRRAGVRWGLDAQARAPYGLATVAQNTWRHGLDRILLGVTMEEDGLRSLGTALPLDDVDSTEVDLAGRLAELLDRLDAVIDALDTDQPLDGWVAALSDAVDAFAEVSPEDAWQVGQAKATLAAAAAEGSAADAVLRLADVRALLGDRLAGRPTRANFRTGHLTVCTMVPMRSVPHRVVCLLGLDDGVFPRTTRVDGDDILARDPRVGERDQRAEDRQLFLDAILAARERLVVLYTGADERTGAGRPPAVPLGELLDVLDRTAATPDGAPVRDRVVVRHPLQPFDARNFVDGALRPAGPFSFDTASYDGSLALRDGQARRPPFLHTPLSPPEETGAVALDTLTRFLEHPVRAFLRERLDVRTADEQTQPADTVPVAPDNLELWQVGDRMLRARLAGLTRDAARHVEQLRGEVPPGRLGDTLLTPITDDVDGVLHQCRGLLGEPAESYDVSVPLPSGLSLQGTVPRVHGRRVLRIEYSRLSAKHRIRAWVQLLALTAQHPDREWIAVTVGRGDQKSPVLGSFLGPVTTDLARQCLDELVAVHRLGLTRPLPAPPRTALAYAEKRRGGANPDNAAAFAGKQWVTQGGAKAWGEYDDGDHRRCGLRTLDDLLTEGPVPPMLYDDEPHLFGQLARTVWTPLLDAEVINS
jgi:exodeoxyribonuclease V gamma subunit